MGSEERDCDVFVAASSRCFSNLPLDQALRQLVDLEYSYVELMVHEADGHLKPSQVALRLEEAIAQCRQTHRLTPVALSVETAAPQAEAYRQFAACCKLAKAIKVVTISVRCAELGTPFNAEVERLRELVAIAALDGCRVGLLTEAGRMTEDPDTAAVLCDQVKGLGITLDPSHYLCHPRGPVRFEQLMKYVYHVRLRDSSQEQFQVRVGQGQIDYSRLINQLNKAHYDRALCVDIQPMPGVDQLAELRKIRLLLETLT